MEILSDMKRPNDRTNINYFHSLVKKSPPLTELSNYVNDKILKPTKIAKKVCSFNRNGIINKEGRKMFDLDDFSKQSCFPGFQVTCF